MILQESEIEIILRSFPLVHSELSYEIMTHKKVYNSDIILAIPEGKKCIAWFTIYRSENVCFLLEMDKENKISNVKLIRTGFDVSLALGTIFSGTLFEYNFVSCYCIEDIYYYKNKKHINVSYEAKLNLLCAIFKSEVSQCVLNRDYTLFGLPLMNKDFNSLLSDIQKLPYKISEIKHRFFNTRKIFSLKYFKPGKINNNNINNNNNKNNNNNIKVVFKVTADIEPDIYNLFVLKNGKEEYYDVAYISDYTTSVMMNRLFRKIKENENLDAIEESDDEEEFEDVKESKYVFLDRSFNINCIYNYKFKRWCPVSLADDTETIVSLSFIENYTKKY